jgi:hypothetical protein
MPAPTAKTRARIERTPTRTRVVIPARRKIGSILLLSALAVVWLWGETMIAGYILQQIGNQSFSLLSAVFLLFWTIGGASILVVLFWNLAGREIITLVPGALRLERKVLGIGWTRTITFIELPPMTIDHEPSRTTWMGSWPDDYGAFMRGWIAFQHEGSLMRFGMGIDEAEANYVIEQLAVVPGAAPEAH